MFVSELQTAMKLNEILHYVGNTKRTERNLYSFVRRKSTSSLHTIACPQNSKVHRKRFSCCDCVMRSTRKVFHGEQRRTTERKSIGRGGAPADRVIDTCKSEQRLGAGSSNSPFNDCRKLSVNSKSYLEPLQLRHANIAFKSTHNKVNLHYDRSTLPGRRRTTDLCV